MPKGRPFRLRARVGGDSRSERSVTGLLASADRHCRSPGVSSTLHGFDARDADSTLLGEHAQYRDRRLFRRAEPVPDFVRARPTDLTETVDDRSRRSRSTTHPLLGPSACALGSSRGRRGFESSGDGGGGPVRPHQRPVGFGLLTERRSCARSSWKPQRLGPEEFLQPLSPWPSALRDRRRADTLPRSPFAPTD